MEAGAKTGDAEGEPKGDAAEPRDWSMPDDVLCRWWSVGSNKGFTTFSDIASFLLNQYDSKLTRQQSRDACVRCHRLLTLYCMTCGQQACNNDFQGRTQARGEDHVFPPPLGLTTGIQQQSDIQHGSDVKPDIQHRGDIKPDIQYQSKMTPDIHHQSKITPDIQHQFKMTPDIHHQSKITPDIHHQSKLTPDIQHQSKLTPDVQHGSDIHYQPDITTNVQHQSDVTPAVTPDLGRPSDVTTHQHQSGVTPDNKGQFPLSVASPDIICKIETDFNEGVTIVNTSVGLNAQRDPCQSVRSSSENTDPGDVDEDLNLHEPMDLNLGLYPCTIDGPRNRGRKVKARNEKQGRKKRKDAGVRRGTYRKRTQMSCNGSAKVSADVKAAVAAKLTASGQKTTELTNDAGRTHRKKPQVSDAALPARRTCRKKPQVSDAELPARRTRRKRTLTSDTVAKAVEGSADIIKAANASKITTSSQETSKLTNDAEMACTSSQETSKLTNDADLACTSSQETSKLTNDAELACTSSQETSELLHLAERNDSGETPPNTNTNTTGATIDGAAPGDSSVICHLCGKKMKNKLGLYSHNRRCHLEKKHQCPHCSKAFCKLSLLTRHSYRHAPATKPFACSLCPQAFVLQYLLRDHVRLTHLHPGSFICEVCGKAFNTKPGLTSHIANTHAAHRLFQCPFCCKSFTRKEGMDCHVRTHTGEKPFRCPQCPAAFADSGYLAVHLRFHRGERRFQCGECQFRAFTSSQRTMHMRVHTGERPPPAACSLCTSVLSSRLKLTRHMNNVHGVQSAKGRNRQSEVLQGGRLVSALAGVTTEMLPTGQCPPASS